MFQINFCNLQYYNEFVYEEVSFEPKTFLSIFHPFVMIWSFQQKEVHSRRLYLQGLSQRYKKYVTSLSQMIFLEDHWIHSRNRLVNSNSFKSYFLLS